MDTQYLPLIVPRQAVLGHILALEGRLEPYKKSGIVTSNVLIYRHLKSSGFRVDLNSDFVRCHAERLSITVRQNVELWLREAKIPWCFLGWELRAGLIAVIKTLLSIQFLLLRQSNLSELPVLWSSCELEFLARSVGVKAAPILVAPDSIGNGDLPPLFTPKTPLRKWLENSFKWVNTFYSALFRGKKEDSELLIVPHRETLALARRLLRSGHGHFSLFSWHASLANLRFAFRFKRPAHFFEYKTDLSQHIEQSSLPELLKRIFVDLQAEGIWKIRVPDLQVISTFLEKDLKPLASDAQGFFEKARKELERLKPKAVVVHSPCAYIPEALFRTCSDLKIPTLALSHGVGFTSNLDLWENSSADFVTCWGSYDFALANRLRTRSDGKGILVNTGPVSELGRPHFKSSKETIIGVLFTALFPLGSVFETADYRDEEVLLWLKGEAEAGREIWVRPHPVEHPAYRSYLKSQYGIRLDEERSPESFLSKITVAVTSFSTVIVEAHFRGLPVIWLDLSERQDVPPFEKLPRVWRVRDKGEFKIALEQAIENSHGIRIADQSHDHSFWISDHWDEIFKKTDGLRNLSVLKNFIHSVN